MIPTNRQSRQHSKLMVAIVTSLVVAALPSMSRAEGWELRTTYREVPGTREIESGAVEVELQDEGQSLLECVLAHVRQVEMDVVAVGTLDAPPGLDLLDDGP